MSKFDITISEVERRPLNDLDFSYLTLKLSGKDVNCIFLNTLRRCMIDNIPTYAFPPQNITIPKDGNTSVFNNDQMRLRLSQLPILDTKLELAYLPNEFWKNVDYTKERTLHPLEKQIELNLNVNNTTNSVMFATTNDIKYYEDGQLIENKYNQNYPIVLVELCPNQTFKCHMLSAIGVGENSAIWAGASNVYYKQVNEDYQMTIESNGQFDEYELLWKACKYMQFKMEEIKSLLESQPKPPSSSVELTLMDDTYTPGNIICDILQNRKDVSYAGIYKLNQLIKTVIIRIDYVKELDNPYAPIYETMNHIINMMKHTENLVYKLGGKYMKSLKKQNIESDDVPKKSSKKVSKSSKKK